MSDCPTEIFFHRHIKYIDGALAADRASSMIGQAGKFPIFGQYNLYCAIRWRLDHIVDEMEMICIGGPSKLSVCAFDG